MPITALALVRIDKPETALRVDALSDSVIVHTGLDFASEPELLVAGLAAQLGDALDAHEDPRGVLFIPSVAAPTGKSYDEVVAEVGEGGSWGSLSSLYAQSVQHSGFGDLLGSMLAQMPPSLVASAQAAAMGDRDALGAMGAQVQSLLAGSPALAGLASQLSGMMAQQSAPPVGEELAALDQLFSGFGGGEGAQSSLREMVLEMQGELQKDPAKIQELAKQLFGEGDPNK